MQIHRGFMLPAHIYVYIYMKLLNGYKKIKQVLQSVDEDTDVLIVLVQHNTTKLSSWVTESAL